MKIEVAILFWRRKKCSFRLKVIPPSAMQWFSRLSALYLFIILQARTRINRVLWEYSFDGQLQSLILLSFPTFLCWTWTHYRAYNSMLIMGLLSCPHFYAEHGLRWIINGLATKNQEHGRYCDAKQQLAPILTVWNYLLDFLMLLLLKWLTLKITLWHSLLMDIRNLLFQLPSHHEEMFFLGEKKTFLVSMLQMNGTW